MNSSNGLILRQFLSIKRYKTVVRERFKPYHSPMETKTHETGPEASGRPVKRLRRGVFLLPNLLTTGTLFSGFYAIVAALDGHFDRAPIAIFLAMIFDGLDGRVARWTNTESAFGKEYDSLSDLVAFGLAPALVVYQWGVSKLLAFDIVWGRIGWLVTFLYAVATALRLARFNVRTSVVDKRYFEGLPSPSAAALVASCIWFIPRVDLPEPLDLWLVMIITAIAALLMVSRFAYSSFKGVKLTGRVRFNLAILIPLSFVLLASDPPLVLLALSAGFAFSAPSIWFYRVLFSRRRTG
jgi:CDP-diacylglycerol--serine O-phosphatidyltransferase